MNKSSPAAAASAAARRSKGRRATALTARTADRHALYEIAVQRPEVIIGLIDDMAEALQMPEPRVLREDFCGTAYLSGTWVASDSKRRALGIDIDPETLDWAQRRNREPLGGAARRLELIQDDVMDVRRRADVLVSLNFSHFIYKTRAALLAYLRHAKRCVKPGGFMVMDAFGGPGSIVESVDRRNFSQFDYLWEQEAMDPLTHEITCHIHFQFRNGSKLRRAFSYDWRMWTLPELRELISEAGFDDLGVYFETDDGFIGDVDAVDHYAWVAYFVALRHK